MHGAGGNALAAADALGMLNSLLFLLAERQNSAGALGHGDIRGILGHAHHGTAGDELVSTVLHAAAGIQQQ